MEARILITAGLLGTLATAAELPAQTPIDRGGALELACEAAQGCAGLAYEMPVEELPTPPMAMPLLDPILVGTMQNYAPTASIGMSILPNVWGVNKYIPTVPRVITIETSEPPLRDAQIVPAKFEVTPEIY